MFLFQPFHSSDITDLFYLVFRREGSFRLVAAFAVLPGRLVGGIILRASKIIPTLSRGVGAARQPATFAHRHKFMWRKLSSLRISLSFLLYIVRYKSRNRKELFVFMALFFGTYPFSGVLHFLEFIPMSKRLKPPRHFCVADKNGAELF